MERAWHAPTRLDALNEMIRATVGVRPVPELPEPELTGDQPEPLLDSQWDFTEQCRRLIESKAYANGDSA